MKFSGKMWLIIILKATKNQGFTLSLENTFLKKPQEEIKLTPHSPSAFLRLTVSASARNVHNKEILKKETSSLILPFHCRDKTLCPLHGKCRQGNADYGYINALITSQYQDNQ